MPKKPNAEIRRIITSRVHALVNYADNLRSVADAVEQLSRDILLEADELKNAKPLKPRTKKNAPKVTKAMARNIKALAMAGMSSADIAAHFGVNQGRITDVLNGNYGV